MILYDDERAILNTFISNELENDHKLMEQIDSIFDTSNFEPLKKSYFLYFLLFFFSNYKNLKIIISRIEKIKTNSENNENLYTFITKNLPEEINIFLDNYFKSDELNKIKKLLQDYINTFIELIKEDFNTFWNNIKDSIILNKDFIHSEEITNDALKEKALRWEYLYLRKNSNKRKKIRNYFLSQQNECLKSN